MKAAGRERQEVSFLNTENNLLSNAGFEQEMTNKTTGTGNLTGNWNRYLATGGGDNVAIRTTGEKKSGSYAGMITATGGAIEQDINGLEVGKTYIFSAYVKLSENSLGTDVTLGAKHFSSGSTEEKKSVTSAEWTKLSLEFTYADNTKPARVYFYAANISGGVKAYIDETSLVLKEEGSTSGENTGSENTGSENTENDNTGDATEDLKQATTYYISNEGNDGNSGTSEESPFATIEKLNTITFQPGDRILFKKGDTFTGWFKPKGSGKEGAPIVIASYGEGNTKPKLQLGSTTETTYIMSGDGLQNNAQVNYVIQFVNVEYWEVRDLEILDTSGTSQRHIYKSGITIQANDTLNPTELILDHFIIDNCNIHGFHGPLTNMGKTSGGITMNVITNSARNLAEAKKMQINGIQITNNEIWDVGRSGINFLNVWSDRQDAARWGDDFDNQKGMEWVPYEDFVLRNNYIHDVDGDGAIIDNTLNAVVEYNLVHDCVKNLDGSAPFAVGLFNWNSTNTIFQYNEVFDINYGGGHFAQDCQGIEIDAWNDTTYVQYNYLHDNRGGFMMFCTHTQSTGDKSGLRSYNNIVRYNISQNDYPHPEMGIFNLGEWNIGSQIYNNTLYFTDRALYTGQKYDGGKAYGDADVGQFFMFQSLGGKKVMQFYNNIFYYDYENSATGEKAEINKFGDEHIDYRSNIFYGFSNAPIDDDPEYPNIHLDADDPDILKNPGGAGTGVYTEGKEKLGYQTDLSAYHLAEGSPAINSGIYIENNGGQDYFGNPVTGIPDIGAHETGVVTLKVLSHIYDTVEETKSIVLPADDRATQEEVLKNLIYDKKIDVKVMRGQRELTSYEILEEGDILTLSYEGEEAVYHITFVSGTSPVGEYIPVEYLKATAGSQEASQQQQQAEKALDNDPRTFWHTAWTGSTTDQHWISLEVTRPYLITGYEYTPRLGGSMAGATNGIITQYEIAVSKDGSTWTKQAEGTEEIGNTWPATHAVKTVIFDQAVEASHVRLKALAGENNNATAAEVRLFGIPVYEEDTKPSAPVLTEGPNGSTRVRINWQTPSDESGIREYVLKQGNQVVTRLGGNALYYDVEGLQPATEYSFTLAAIDKAGNESDPAVITTSTTAEEEELTYTITFDPANGEEATVITLTEGEELVLPHEPTKEGAEFIGWYMIQNQKEVPFDQDMEIIHNLNIFAKWKYSKADFILEEEVYWVYSVAEDGKGGYAPSQQRILFDNGAASSYSGYMQTSNTMYNENMSSDQLYRRLLKSSWQFENTEEEGVYYIQNGFTYGYGAGTETGSNGVATVAEGQREKFLVSVEEIAEDGKAYVSIQSVTRNRNGQPSYLKAQNTTPSGDTALAVTFSSIASKEEGTLWYIGEGHSFMDWENGTYLWRTTRGNHHFRIPALATTNDGDVIAVGDLRYNNNGDLGNGHEIDLLRKIRPFDLLTGTYGSFGNELNITESFRNSNEGYGDAAIVADRESDQVLILAAYGTEGYGGNNKSSRILSVDGGETFGKGSDISPQIRGLNPNIHSFFFGSGRIMQSRYIKVGTHYRIYSAILACDTTGTGSNVNYVLYSDDFGVTWNILGNTSVIENTNGNKADEAKIEELPNGDVVINSRNGNNPGRYMNVFSYATNVDGTKDYSRGTWETSKTKQVYEGGDITSQGTNGELMTVFARKKDGTYTHLILQSLPSGQMPITGGNHTGRNHVTVWYKEVADPSKDEDITAAKLASGWRKGRVVQDGESAYSTMAIQADGSIGFFYEDSRTWYDLIYYNFSLEDMTGTGEIPGDYEMAFTGIGSKKVPYVVDNEEKARAYRDVFGAEKVNYHFNEDALAALITEADKENITSGEQLALQWQKVKEAAPQLTVTKEMTEEDILRSLETYVGENVKLEAAAPYEDIPAAGEEGAKVKLHLLISYENTTGDLILLLEKEKEETEKFYTVSFNSISTNDLPSITVKEGETIQLPVPVREGYHFEGWFTLEDGAGICYTEDTPVMQDVTLYAYWIIKTVSGQDIIDLGEVLPEDVPADGVIPKGVWVAGVEDKIYTGTKQVQNFRVYDHKKMLREKVDYTYSYKNNQNGYEYTEEDFEAFTEALLTNPSVKGAGDFEAKKAPQVVLKMKGNYTKNVSLYFRILKPDIGEEAFFVTDDITVSNTGKKQTPAPQLIWTEGGRVLKFKKEFEVVEYTAVKNDKTAFATPTEGGYELTLKGVGNFKGERKIRLYVAEDTSLTSLQDAKVKLEASSLPFDGTPKTPAVLEVKVKGRKLTEGIHYRVEGYDHNQDAGLGSLLLTAVEGSGYTGSRRVTFNITGISMKQVKVNLEKAGYPYTGLEIRPLELVDGAGDPRVEVTYTPKGGSIQTLTEEVHFTAEYEKNVAKGTAGLILRGIPAGGFVGETKVSFKIKASSLNETAAFHITVSGPNMTGDGEEQVYSIPAVKGGVKPEVRILQTGNEARPLLEGVDYTVSVPKNKIVGSTLIKIKGKGNFTGSVKLPLTIIQKQNQEHIEFGEEVVIEAKDKTEALGKKNGWKTSFKVVDRDGKALLAKESGAKNARFYLIEVPEGSSLMPSEEIPLALGSISQIPAGSVIKIVTDLSGNYQGTASGTYRILEEGYDISKATIQLQPQEYTGEEIQVSANSLLKTAVLKYKGTQKQLLLEPQGENQANIEVIHYENNVKKGMAKVTFRGLEGSGFGGIKTVTFKILPRSVWKETWKGIIQ